MKKATILLLSLTLVPVLEARITQTERTTLASRIQPLATKRDLRGLRLLKQEASSKGATNVARMTQMAIERLQSKKMARKIPQKRVVVSKKGPLAVRRPVRKAQDPNLVFLQRIAQQQRPKAEKVGLFSWLGLGNLVIITPEGLQQLKNWLEGKSNEDLRTLHGIAYQMKNQEPKGSSAYLAWKNIEDSIKRQRETLREEDESDEKGEAVQLLRPGTEPELIPVPAPIATVELEPVVPRVEEPVTPEVSAFETPDLPYPDPFNPFDY